MINAIQHSNLIKFLWNLLTKRHLSLLRRFGVFFCAFGLARNRDCDSFLEDFTFLQASWSTRYYCISHDPLGIRSPNMWGFNSKTVAGASEPSNGSCSEFSDDEISVNGTTNEGLECPICCESFNIVENVPYVLWCGHTLCKNCVLGLQWAVVKLPTLPVQLPFLISCPWCNLLTFRLVYKGNLKFPRKNYFLLWMVESLNGDRVKSRCSSAADACGDHLPPPRVWPWNRGGGSVGPPSVGDSDHGRRDFNAERLQSALRKSVILFLNLTAKFPLVFLFLLIVVYAIPASIAVVAVYILVTILFAVPSFLVLYFAYPSLDWLVTEIVA